MSVSNKKPGAVESAGPSWGASSEQEFTNYRLAPITVGSDAPPEFDLLSNRRI